MAAKLKITLVRSIIGEKPALRKTVKALGLRKTGSSVVQPANPAILGMAKAVSHLVAVEEIN